MNEILMKNIISNATETLAVPRKVTLPPRIPSILNFSGGPNYELSLDNQLFRRCRMADFLQTHSRHFETPAANRTGSY